METRKIHTETEPINWPQYFDMVLVGEATPARISDTGFTEDSTLEQRGDLFVNALKQLFLFLPGAIALFWASLFMFVVLFSGYWDILQFIFNLPGLALYGFMVIFGMGNIKNPRHLLMPFSIVIISLTLSVVSFIFGGAGNNRFLFSSAVYLVPLILIAPVLVKALSETETE